MSSTIHEVNQGGVRYGQPDGNKNYEYVAEEFIQPHLDKTIDFGDFAQHICLWTLEEEGSL